jgi:hypothetical protein
MIFERIKLIIKCIFGIVFSWEPLNVYFFTNEELENFKLDKYIEEVKKIYENKENIKVEEDINIYVDGDLVK